jgi:hypothetical protein
LGVGSIVKLMMNAEKIKQAERVAQRFFTKGRVRVSYEDASTRLHLSQATWWNYSGLLREAGLAVAAPSETGSKKSDLKITNKGKALLARMTEAATSLAAQDGQVPPIDSRALTPQALQDLVDEYNRHNPSWPFELVPKGFRKEATDAGVVIAK